MTFENQTIPWLDIISPFKKNPTLLTIPIPGIKWSDFYRTLNGVYFKCQIRAFFACNSADVWKIGLRTLTNFQLLKRKICSQEDRIQIDLSPLLEGSPGFLVARLILSCLHESKKVKKLNYSQHFLSWPIRTQKQIWAKLTSLTEPFRKSWISQLLKG